MKVYYLTADLPDAVLDAQASHDRHFVPQAQRTGKPTLFYRTDFKFVGRWLVECLQAADFGVEFRLVTKQMVSEAEWSAYGDRIKLLKQIRMLNSGDPAIWKAAGLPHDQQTQLVMVYYRVAERAKRQIRKGRRKVYLWFSDSREKFYFYKVERRVAMRLWPILQKNAAPELVFGYTHKTHLDFIQRMQADGSIAECQNNEAPAYLNAAAAEREVRKEIYRRRDGATRRLMAYTESALIGPYIDTVHETIARAYLTAHRMLNAFAYSSGLELTGEDRIDERLVLERNLNAIKNRYFVNGSLARWLRVAVSDAESYAFCGSEQNSALLTVYLGSAQLISRINSAYHQAVASVRGATIQPLWHKHWLRFLVNTALPDKKETQRMRLALRHEYKRVMLQVFPDFIRRLLEADEAWLRAKRGVAVAPSPGEERTEANENRTTAEIPKPEDRQVKSEIPPVVRPQTVYEQIKGAPDRSVSYRDLAKAVGKSERVIQDWRKNSRVLKAYPKLARVSPQNACRGAGVSLHKAVDAFHKARFLK